MAANKIMRGFYPVIDKVGRRFTSLLKFSFPTIIMMLFLSLYTMVDGVMVSRLISTAALSAVNIIFPLVSVIIGAGIMLSSGASAIIARKMGEGRPREAKEDFTFVVIIGVAFGAVLTALGMLFTGQLVRLLGANEAIFGLCCEYTFILACFIIPSMLQLLFQNFFVTAGKPALGLAITILGGVANIVLDYVFIAVFDMGIGGAAVATGIGYSISGFFGLFYFAFNRKCSLYFVKPKWKVSVLKHTCLNGASEMVTNLSSAIVTLLFNLVMIDLAGEDGVAAISILLYAQFFLTAVYLGYSSGIAPVISYNYGSGNKPVLNRIFKNSVIFITAGSLATCLASLLFGGDLAAVFAPKGSAVFNLATEGFYLFSFSFLFMGINIFASSIFTALSNGLVSAVISFTRTFAFIVPALLLLPGIIGLNGVWLAIPIAETLGAIVTVWCFVKNRGYFVNGPSSGQKEG